MEMNFCRRCGIALTHNGNDEYSCASGHVVYANPSPATGIFLITASDDIVMSVRGIEPHIGKLDTFGGYIDIGETVEEGLVRELREELSLEPHEYETPRYLTSAVGQFYARGENNTVLGCFFWSRLLTNRELLPSDDVASIHTAPIDKFDPSAFHNDDIRQAFTELQRQWPSIMSTL